MATLLWMLLMLYPYVALSQSGDDGESTDIDCWSEMKIAQSDLVCILNDCYPEICEIVATACEVEHILNCYNASMEDNKFSFLDLSPILKYEMQIHVKGGQNQTYFYKLDQIVKISTPEISNAAYKLDEAVIDIKFDHDYVKRPEFQVEFWVDHSTVKEKITVNYQQIRIGADKLQDSEMYNVRARARPVDYFDGSWTNWSPVKRFKVNRTTVQALPVTSTYWCVLN